MRDSPLLHALVICAVILGCAFALPWLLGGHP